MERGSQEGSYMFRIQIPELLLKNALIIISKFVVSENADGKVHLLTK